MNNKSYIIKKFISFLKENNCYKQYKKNLYKDHCNIFQFLNNCGMGNFILLAFTWIDTEEGDDFWREIEARWFSYVRTHFNIVEPIIDIDIDWYDD